MSTPNEWWQTFFTGLAVDFWLQATTEDQTQMEIGFIQEALQVAPPAALLDVPCGGGRHSLALAARGYRMTGVDFSSDFLTVARSDAEARSMQVIWDQRDMTNLPWREQFDGAFSFGNSFGYCEDEGNAAFLKTVAKALKPGARFVLDASYITEILLPSLQLRSRYQVGNVLAIANRRYDHVEGRLHVEYTLSRDGRTEKAAMSARLYSYRELCRLLEEAGFTNVQGWGSLTREPFRLGSNRLLMMGVRSPSGVRSAECGVGNTAKTLHLQTH